MQFCNLVNLVEMRLSCGAGMPCVGLRSRLLLLLYLAEQSPFGWATGGSVALQARTKRLICVTTSFLS
jgi:hypothetical protein